MEQTTEQVLLNLGCGFNKLPNHINCDAYGICNPDLIVDLNKLPMPFEDNSVDGIEMWHVLEHIPDWWGVFCDCIRVLKPGGYLNIRVPDESSATALTYRDHFHVFSLASFHGIKDAKHSTNAWAATEFETIPVRLVNYHQVPYKQYNWMPTWLLRFCAQHMRNFIWEQRFYFVKIGGEHE